MNSSKRVKCYIKNGGNLKRCLLNGVHTEVMNADEHNAAAPTADSQSRQPQIVSYG